MDHVHRIDLLPAGDLEALTRRSDLRAGAQLAGHLGTIGARLPRPVISLAALRGIRAGAPS